MDSQKQNDQINLRELIETLLRGKWIIIGITVLAIVLSVVASFAIQPKLYQAKTVLMASPIDLAGAKKADGDLVEYLTKFPTLTIDTYLQQIVAPEVLQATAEKLDLRGSSGKPINPEGLRGSITVNHVKDTNLLEVSVRRESPQEAAQIADTLAASFIDFITENTQRMGQQAVELIEDRLVTEEANLRDKSDALANYWKENDNIDVLKGTVTALKEELVSTRKNLLLLTRSIESNTNTLVALASLVEPADRIDLEAFWLTLGQDPKTVPTGPQLNLTLDQDALSQALLQVDLARIQTELIQQSSEQAALDQQLARLEDELTQAQIQLTEDEYRFNALNRDMEMAKQAYDAYQQKYKDAMLTAASELGKSSVIITSAAIVPSAAVSPNKPLNLAIGTVLGFMLGLFVALFVDYWKRSKPNQNGS